MTRHEFTYSSQISAEERMLDDLDQVCRKANLPEDQSYYFKLVVSEAFCNAIVHGNRLDPKKQVQLILTLNELEIAADIIDQGRGGLRRLSQRPKASKLADHGRGVDLMHHFADVVDFGETPDGYLIVSIRLKRTQEGRLI